MDNLKINTNNHKLILSLVLFATLTRIAIPPLMSHPINFSPIDAIALFCGAYFNRRLMAIGVTLFSVWIGDLLIDKMLTGHWEIFYQGFYWQYGSYVLIALLGSTLINKIRPATVGAACLTSSILFFILSNLGVWFSGMYPMTAEGLIACYVAAIPFFKNTLLSDLFFTMVLFGSFEWLQVKSPKLVSQKLN